MASVTNLTNLTPATTSAGSRSSSVLPRSSVNLRSFNVKLSSASHLSLRYNPQSRPSLFVRCSASGGNGSTAKRTTLHDLYEKEGQSPWYDNLCRPVTDLLPFIARGVRGVTSNPALIFSIARYEAVIDAYLDGLEASGLDDLSGVTSVASFFVSRVDTLMDKMLEKIGTPEALDLRGKAAVAQAVLAYQLYQKKFSGPRWEALVKKGAKKQRLLWASTSVKNPAYSDTLYVAPLIGPDTVSTMPDQALEAFIDHGTVKRTIDANVSEAEAVYSAIEKLAIDWNKVGEQLEEEGVDSFKKSFESLLATLQDKANTLKLASH